MLNNSLMFSIRIKLPDAQTYSDNDCGLHDDRLGNLDRLGHKTIPATQVDAKT